CGRRRGWWAHRARGRETTTATTATTRRPRRPRPARRAAMTRDNGRPRFAQAAGAQNDEAAGAAGWGHGVDQRIVEELLRIGGGGIGHAGDLEEIAHGLRIDARRLVASPDGGHRLVADLARPLVGLRLL